MKKNIVLLAVLISLGIFTYFFEEIGNKVKMDKELARTQLIDTSRFGELLELRTKNSHLVFRGPKVFALKDNVPCSNEKVNKFFQEISSLRIVETLSEQEVLNLGEDNFFNSQDDVLSFEFEKNSFKFVVGKKLDFSEHFYVKYTDKNKKKYFVVKDAAPKKGVYSEQDEHRSELAYLKFKNLVYINDSFFYDTRVFKDTFYERMQKRDNVFDEFHISNKRNKAYTIDFKRRITSPSPFKGIDYDNEEFKKYFEYILKLEAKNMYVGYSVKLLKKLVSQVNIKDALGRTISLALYSAYGSLEGAFLVSSLDKNLYELHDFDRGLFFQNVQDFWDLMPKKNFINNPFDFLLGRDKIKLNIDNGRGFKLVNLTNSLEPIHQRFKAIFDIIDIRANYITKLSSQFKPKGLFLSFVAGKQEMLITRILDEFVVIDVTNQLKYHYKFKGAQKIPLNANDYFLEL